MTEMMERPLEFPFSRDPFGNPPLLESSPPLELNSCTTEVKEASRIIFLLLLSLLVPSSLELMHKMFQAVFTERLSLLFQLIWLKDIQLKLECSSTQPTIWEKSLTLLDNLNQEHLEPMELAQ